MISIFKKEILAEVIHKEFDNSEEKINKACQDLFNELNIVTFDKVKNKSNILQELGFVNSEAVTKIKTESVIGDFNISLERAEYLKYLKFVYPQSKFITTDELDRICSKYNLIHAPVKNYIKDVPEKNVYEMKNAQPLRGNDKVNKEYIINYTIYKYTYNANEYVSIKETKYWENPIKFSSPTNEAGLRKYLIDKYKPKKVITFNEITTTTIDKSGLFIAAPKSHFKLDGVEKSGKFGFFTQTVTVTKDPIVFEFLQKDFVRILTKWGTDDDQSFMDDSLINETLN